MSLQEQIDDLRTTIRPSIWTDSPNEWLRLVAPVELARLTETFAEKVLNATRMPNNRAGYDLICGSRFIEVKAASVSIMNGRPILSWKNIRPSDPYTHVLFIAIYPDNIRAFLVRKELIPREEMKPMSTSDTGHVFQLYTRNVNTPPNWLTRFEIVLSPDGTRYELPW